MAPESEGGRPSVFFVLDGRRHVFDAMVHAPGHARLDPRPAIGRPMIDLVGEEYREHLGAALRDATGANGTSTELDAVLLLGASPRPVRLRVSPGVRFVHVAAEPREEEAAPEVVEASDESDGTDEPPSWTVQP